MISKQEILSIARTTKLLPTTVEKDYVLSWVLCGISRNPRLSQWFFKGGTCLKKCYFETYRFSEDLDFTAPSGSIYSKEEIKAALAEVADFVYQEVGIQLMTREIEVEESINKQNHITYIAKFTYAGPLNLPSRTQQRVKFDITDDEIIVDAPDNREVFHLYSDRPDLPAKVRCYSVNEILAEKTRALYERQGRARDIYDVVNISRSFREHVDIKKAQKILKEKFAFKLLAEPSVDFIFSQIDFTQLQANWKGQLEHQVQVLPSVESFYNELRSALSWWIDEKSLEPELTIISAKKEEITLPRVHFPEALLGKRKIASGNQQINSYSSDYLDSIRYAARNRLCAEIHYHGHVRLIEPYSIRRAGTGNILLYSYEIKKGSATSRSIKAYKINEITDAEITQIVFTPRYAVEL